MPRGRKPNSTPKKKVQSITCLSCGETKKTSDFYVSSSVFNATTGRVQYCKTCCADLSCDSNGNIDVDKFMAVLKKIDKPFLPDILQSAYEESNNSENKAHPIGLYFKNLNSLPQNKKLTWSDSATSDMSTSQENINLSSDFKVTNQIVDKWGNGYKPEEYEAFEKKYDLLKNNYIQRTAMHTEALLNYIRYRVKEELATAAGDVGDAKAWGALAKDAATAAKINPSQLSKADLTDGLSTFGELIRATEQAVDIIEILPRFKRRPQDKVDFTLWCYINYIRDLKGLPLCDYQEIYQFYEERKKEYKQHANTDIFDDEFEEEDE